MSMVSLQCRLFPEQSVVCCGSAEKRPEDSYNPHARRAHTVRGGTDQIPPPFWENQRFDVYGRDSKSQRSVKAHVDGIPCRAIQLVEELAA